MVSVLKRSDASALPLSVLRRQPALSRLAWRALEARRRTPPTARELHDGVAQGLYSLRLASQTGKPIHELLTSLMEEVDQLAKNLWPPCLSAWPGNGAADATGKNRPGGV